ncbi:hypothetical protein SGL43_07362 [Streptomyces globisporus]|uniref:Uncharacterized protein n=1 Tax=Streptomyces globisporus TaxID=1908 RepID=A0ABN8VEX0_STRGL|nr:hypothetical protein SGL43_07362 [Streptomyces globisporus]
MLVPGARAASHAAASTTAVVKKGARGAGRRRQHWPRLSEPAPLPVTVWAAKAIERL